MSEGEPSTIVAEKAGDLEISKGKLRPATPERGNALVSGPLVTVTESRCCAGGLGEPWRGRYKGNSLDVREEDEASAKWDPLKNQRKLECDAWRRHRVLLVRHVPGIRL